jgi:MinD-like ATPase involved in chromosome partitioning or flagellar assembly
MKNRAKVVAITSFKGGSGKTSLTYLLARYYAETENKQVLVVDFDSGAGLTSLLYDRHIQDETISIVEVLYDVMHYVNPNESFQRAIIQTRHQYSNSNQGSIFLLPSKPTLDNLLAGTNRNLLNAAIGQLNLPDDYIILIDSGPNAVNVRSAIQSADVVFIPFQFSRQDAFPAIDTLIYVLQCQWEKDLPYFGGWVYIQAINTQWEKHYLANVKEAYQEIRYSNRIVCPTQDPFIQMKPSRIIHRGVHMTWSIRDELFDPIRKMAARIKRTEKLLVLER